MELVTAWYTNIVLFVYGIAFGSFLNVLSDRLPNEKSIMGRSRCEKCRHVLAWYDLLPVLSFVLLRGRCRYCRTKLSWYYPVSEVLTGIMFVLAWNFAPASLIAGDNLFLFYLVKLIFIVVTSALVVIFFADLKFQIIPDSMQVVLLLMAIGVRLIESHFNLGQLVFVFVEGLIVMAPILLLFVLTKGRGMGFGDVKLAFVLGILFGAKLGFMVLYLSFIFGALVGLILILSRKKKLKSKIAFGPFIVLAVFTAIFFRVPLLSFIQAVWGI